MSSGDAGGVAQQVGTIVDRDARRFNYSHAQTLALLQLFNLWVSAKNVTHLMHRKEPVTHPGHTVAKGLNKEEHDDHPTTDCPRHTDR